MSMTSQVCKVLQRLVKREIVGHLVEDNFISKHQHGFIHGTACQYDLLKTFEEWSQALDEGSSLDVMYFDFKKAVDSVPHRRLTAKLRSYGIQGCAQLDY